MIALHEPQFNGNEWKYIKDCLDSGWVSSVGKYVELFEKKLAEYTGAKYVVACCNGTAALHTALLLSGVGHSDEVILPSLSFVASSNVIRYCGAYPVFMDSELKHFNIDIQKLENFLNIECKLTKRGLVNLKTKRIIKAIMAVHILGYPCDMKELVYLAGKFGLKVVEDAAESMGSFLDSKHLGTIGDIGCLSFNGNKIITTGGGGAILTNNKKYYEQAKYLTQQAKEPHRFEYIHNELGYNYRLTNIQAALGTAQLEQVEKFISKKISIEKIYRKYLSEKINIYLPECEENVRWNRWIFGILLKDIKSIASRNKKINFLLDKKIGVRPFWRPIHLQKIYKNFQNYKIENTLKIYKTGMHLPSSTSLTENEIKKICSFFSEI